MSVVSVNVQSGGLSGAFTLEGVREYVKTYIVETGSTSDGAKTVVNAPGLPRKGWVYSYGGETDPGALCLRVVPRQVPENPLWWEVTCEYSSVSGGGIVTSDPRYDVDDPLSAPPVVDWGHWEETRVLTHDVVTGLLIVNSAGCQFDPPVTRKVKQRMVTIVRNEGAYPIVLDQQLTGTANLNPFYGWGPGTALLEDISASAQFSQGMLYWRVRYEIRFRKPDWKKRPADAGTQYFKTATPPFGALITNDDGTTKLFNAEDDGVYSTNLVMLHPDGRRMSQNDVMAGLAGFLEFNVVELKSFAPLNL